MGTLDVLLGISGSLVLAIAGIYVTYELFRYLRNSATTDDETTGQSSTENSDVA